MTGNMHTQRWHRLTAVQELCDAETKTGYLSSKRRPCLSGPTYCQTY